jgi:membrane protease YdiL (CAAX protease family)
LNSAPRKNAQPPRKSWKQRLQALDFEMALRPSALMLCVFSLLFLSMLLENRLLADGRETLDLLLLHLLLLLLPAAVWCRYRGKPLTSRLRLQPLRASSVPLLVCAYLALFSGAMVLLMRLGTAPSIEYSYSLYRSFEPLSLHGGFTEFLLGTLAYAILPAVCEEWLFRGILCAEYENAGVARALLVSSLYFALLHFNAPLLPVFFFSGLLLAATLYALRSLYASILVHVAYNLTCLLALPALTAFYNRTGNGGLLTVLLTAVFLLSAALFCGFASRQYRTYYKAEADSSYRHPQRDETGAVRTPALLPSLTAGLCGLLWLIAVLFGERLFG